ncbi:MAG: glycosyltransferase [Bacteroidetes bacterium]|nr:glycosyltransferase [Bacteroidota bacterium]
MSTTLLLLSLFLLLAYSWQLWLIRKRWREMPEWRTDPDYRPATKVSILVPVRNEGGAIGACLFALGKQTYPAHLIDIHVIDDHSTDNSINNARNIELPNLRFHHLPAHLTGKKAALTAGVQHSRGEIIFTIDGDCVADPDWLRTAVAAFEKKNLVMLCGAVSLEPANSVFTTFQSLDFCGMMGISAVGVHTAQLRLCNGANLGFRRKAFVEVGGYEGLHKTASGDDIGLLDKMETRFPGRVDWLKSRGALVRTRPQNNWSDFLRQRIRWAGKTTRNPHWPGLILSGLVFGASLAVLLALILIPWWTIYPFIVFFAIKLVSDYLFLYEMSGYFNRRDLMTGFFISEILHIIYWITVGVGALLLRKGSWKGRAINLK